MTTRQRRVEFCDNLVVPDGPPVMFHARAKCRRKAAEYEQRLMKDLALGNN